VFDDIVDHGYDSIESETHRMQAVLQEISRLQGLDLAHLRRYHHTRLENNWHHLASLVDGRAMLYYKKLKEIGYELQIPS
jgi:hypothetical protein